MILFTNYERRNWNYTKTPEDYEQSYLPTLEEQDKICTSEVQNFTNRDHIATHQEIMYIIGRLEEYKK